ncbi:hypothetical protein V1477_001259 [Vespula maculifrons]|uniref:Uncharacterized protein n=1 Tax=Vespula maculifrons TaxID=7453 RepID=A0ABD2D0H1_VESMC
MAAGIFCMIIRINPFEASRQLRTNRCRNERWKAIKSSAAFSNEIHFQELKGITSSETYMVCGSSPTTPKQTRDVELKTRLLCPISLSRNRAF